MEIKSRKLLFVLILIGLVNAASGCDDAKDPSQRNDGGHLATGGIGTGDSGIRNAGGTSGSAGAGGRAVSGGAGGASAGTVGPIINGGAGGAGGTTTGSICTGGQSPWTQTVKSPELGVSPRVAALCTQPAGQVQSYRAGRVTLALQSSALTSALGKVEVPAALQPLVINTPRITVEEAAPKDLGGITVTGISRTGSGFSFNLTWKTPLSNVSLSAFSPSLTIRVYLDLACNEQDSGTRNVIVESITYFNLCAGPDHSVWVASGDTCLSCEMVCEMAAIPIVPAERPDGLALPRALSAEIIPVVNLGRSIALFVDHRGARGPISYAWKVSAGTLSSDDQSEAVWELPSDPGPHLVQVAIRDQDSAIVEALRWKYTV
jgi:hypothetical protein